MRPLHVLSLAALCLFLMGSQCGTPKPDPVIPEDTADCPAACEHMRKIPREKGSDVIGCEEAEDLPDGTPCEIFCVETQGYGYPLKPSCVMTLASCDELGPKCFDHPE